MLHFLEAGSSILRFCIRFACANFIISFAFLARCENRFRLKHTHEIFVHRLNVWEIRNAWFSLLFWKLYNLVYCFILLFFFWACWLNSKYSTKSTEQESKLIALLTAKNCFETQNHIYSFHIFCCENHKNHQNRHNFNANILTKYKNSTNCRNFSIFCKMFLQIFITFINKENKTKILLFNVI